MSARIY